VSDPRPEPFFTDPAQRPTDETIRAALGPTVAAAWQELFARLDGLTPTWRFYNDGKSWLLKLARKTQTVCWVLVSRGAFQVSFFFPERLTGKLLESELGERTKDAIRAGAPTGKLRAVVVRFGPRRGVADVLALVALKQTLK
jgi:hypothetical protein